MLSKQSLLIIWGIVGTVGLGVAMCQTFARISLEAEQRTWVKFAAECRAKQNFERGITNRLSLGVIRSNNEVIPDAQILQNASRRQADVFTEAYNAAMVRYLALRVPTGTN